MKPWKPEFEITPEHARKLIKHQFPKLKLKSLQPIGVGWDNTVFKLNDLYVFRFPRRQIAVPLIQTEASVLPRLQTRLSVPVPNPLFAGKPDEDYPWPFLGYSFLPGITACKAHLSQDERKNLAVPLATFLKELHAIAEAEARKWGMGDDPLARFDIENRIPKIEENLSKIKAINLFDNVAGLVELLSRLKDARDDGLRSLVHGDFYVRHILVDEEHKLSGIIDWGDAHVGHPAIDLRILYDFVPPDVRADFTSIYGAISENTAALARFRALNHTSILTLFAHDIGDTDLLRECQMSLRLLAEAT